MRAKGTLGSSSMVAVAPMKAALVCALLALPHCNRGKTDTATGSAPPPTAAASAAPAPEPLRVEEILASGQTSPRSLVVDNGFLYWVNDEPQTPDNVTTSVVLRMSVNGGQIQNIAKHQDEMEMDANQEVAVAGGNVYWAAGKNDVRGIFAAPVTGGKVRKNRWRQGGNRSRGGPEGTLLA